MYRSATDPNVFNNGDDYDGYDASNEDNMNSSPDSPNSDFNNNIQTNYGTRKQHKNDFSVVLYITDPLFDYSKPQQYFENQCIDYYETYNENKKYVFTQFNKDFGCGHKPYMFEKWFMRKHIQDDMTIYIVAVEHIAKKELEQLKPYCQCYNCSIKWYHMFYKQQCPHCIKCLNTDKPNMINIKKARVAYNKSVMWYNMMNNINFTNNDF